MNCKDKKNLLIGLTGSVATIKIYQLITIMQVDYNMKIVATQSSLHFFDAQSIKKQLQIEVYTDEQQYQLWNKRGDPVLHINLKNWADCFLIAPLGANTLAKIANGLCDNLLTLICRAWNMTKQQNKLNYPLIICPAMNSDMYKHPITSKQLEILRQYGIIIVDPIEKILMCGQVGIGAMQSLQKIAAITKKHINKQK